MIQAHEFTFRLSKYGRAMVAYSDENVWIVFVPFLAYSSPTTIVMQVRAGSQASHSQITDFIFHAAVPKVSQLSSTVCLINYHSMTTWLVKNLFSL